MTAYTALRATERGVLFFAEQSARVERTGGPEAARAFRRFAAEAAPGAWSWRWEDGTADARPLPGSRLFDGMPSLVRPSPLAESRGAVEKTPPPNPYAALRRDGVSLLLSSPDGTELWESCSAALLAYHGRALIRVPDDRPRVRSVAEAHLRSVLDVQSAPVAAGTDALVLINAVIGVCVLGPERSGGVPASVLDALRAAVAASARRG